jgi:hypothetical protein
VYTKRSKTLIQEDKDKKDAADESGKEESKDTNLIKT